MVTTNKQITLETVYERVRYIGDSAPGFSVSGGTVNLYNSIKASSASDAPANIAAMELDDGGTYGVGYHSVDGDSDYIAWEKATGSPVVKTKNLIS